MSTKRYTVCAGAKPIKNLGERQFNLASFLLRHQGWHSLGGSPHPNGRDKRLAASLERKGCVEIARHSGDWGRDWQLRWKQTP